MENRDEILRQQLREQIALEEHLCRIIEDQVEAIDGEDFSDAKNLLINTRQILERHFTPLNELLDKLDQEAAEARSRAVAGNGLAHSSIDFTPRGNRISLMLRDDYSALNLITINNTLLHTTALALDRQEVADTALKHLKNLAPLVLKIGELVPEVVVRELNGESGTIDLSLIQAALKNAQLVMRRAV